MIKKLKEVGLFHLLSFNMLVLVLGFISQLVIAKILQVDEVGYYKLIITYFNIITVLATFGLSTSLIKKISEKTSNSEMILSQAFSFAVISTILVIVICAILFYSNLIFINPTVKNVLSFLLLIAPVIVFSNILNAYIQGKKEFKQFSYINMKFKILNSITLILLIWYFGLHGIIFSMLLSYVYLAIKLYKFIDFKKLKVTFNHSNSFTIYSIYAMLTIALGILNNNIDIIVIDFTINDKEILGQYAFVGLIYIALIQITSSVQSIVLPYFSENSFSRKYIYSKLIKAQISLFLFSIIVSTIVYYCYPIFIQLVYEDKYTSGIPILNIYLIKYIIFNSFSLIGVMIISLGLFKLNFIMLLFLSLISPIVTYQLITNYSQFYGAAYSQIFVYILNMIILYFYAIYIFKNFDNYQKNIRIL